MLESGMYMRDEQASEGTYQHVISSTVCPIVLLNQLVPLLLVALVLPHIGVELRVAYVGHEEDGDEHEEL